MNLYDSELKGNDEIFNAVKEIVDKENLGNKIKIVRMFSAAKREYRLNQLRINLKRNLEESTLKRLLLLMSNLLLSWHRRTIILSMVFGINQSY